MFIVLIILTVKLLVIQFANLTANNFSILADLYVHLHAHTHIHTHTHT